MVTPFCPPFIQPMQWALNCRWMTLLTLTLIVGTGEQVVANLVPAGLPIPLAGNNLTDLAQRSPAGQSEAPGDREQRQGFALRDAGQYDAAMAAFQRALKAFQQDYQRAQRQRDRAAEANAIAAMGGVSLSQGQTWLLAGRYTQALTDLQAAIAALQRALTLAQSLKDADLTNTVLFRLVLTHNGQGTAFSQLNRKTEALQADQQALALVQQYRDRFKPPLALLLEASARRAIGLRYGELGQPAQAAESYQMALQVQRQLGSDPSTEISLLGILATLYDTLSQYPKALQTAQQALTLVRQTRQDPNTEAMLLTAMGNYLQAMGQYRQAIQQHEQALAIAKRIGDRRLESGALNNLGNLYDEQGQYNRALAYREQTVALADEALQQVEAGDTTAIQAFCVQATTAQTAGYSRDLCLKLSRSARGTALNNLGGSYAKLGRYAEARKLRQEALELTRRLGERDSEATVLNNLGFIDLQTGDYASALAYFQQALKMAIAVGNQAAQSRTLSNLGMVYAEQGDYAKSLEYRQKALAIAQKLKAPSLQVTLFDNIGTVYGYLGDHRRALAYVQRSLKLSQTLGLKPTTQLGNLGFYYESAGAFDQARKAYQQVLRLAQENGDRQNEATALTKLANVDWAEGYYALSLQKRQQAYQLYQDMGDRPNEAIVLTWLARSYRILGQPDRALAALQQARILGQTMGMRRIEANVLSQLGAIHQEQRHYAEALAFHRQALAMQEEINEAVARSKTLTSIGTVLVRQGNPTAAIASFQQALQMQRAIGVRPDAAITLRELGLAYAAQGKSSLAIQTLQQAATLHRTVNDREQEGITLSELGSVLFATRQFQAAGKALSQAVRIFDQLRSGLSDRDNVALFETQLNTYQRLQQVLIAQNQPAIALEMAERGRARAFIELLAKRVSTPQAIQRVPTAIDLKNIQRIAKQRRATLVAYTVLPNELYSWVIKPTGAIAFRQTPLVPEPRQLTAAVPPTTSQPERRGDLDGLQPITNLTTFVTQTRDAIGAHPRARTTATPPTAVPSGTTQLAFESSAVGVRSRLRALHQLLIEPISDLLPRDPRDRVIFIPQGPLFLVPFAALRNRQGQYLIEQHTILTVPAIQVLDLTHQQQERIGKRSSTAATALIVGAPAPMPEGLEPLEGMQAEATEIATLLKTQPLIGAQATKAAILPQLQQARMVHLATHGLFDEVTGLGSKIALASTNPAEGYLTAEEILSLNLQAELVVLSACNTGRGKVTGDGVIGLSRSLLSAGVPSVVVSLWSVYDASTSVLMTEFYRNLQDRQLDKAQALRQAMLTVMQRTNDPIEWAAFTLIGEP